MSKETLNELINPSPLMRPAPFWSWNDKLDKDELVRQIHQMAAAGWGSYFMHSRVGLVTEYLSDEWMDLINTCADEAAKTGTFAWLYDEDKWPSGFAGGLVPEKSEAYRAHALVLVKKGDATEDDTPLRTVEHAGLEYQICKRVSAMGNPWFNGTCFVDLMNPDAIREFINCTHEKYKSACGRHFGKSIPGIFTDEPAYLSFWISSVIPAVPWSEHLQKFFLKSKGYNILDRVEQLFFDTGDYHKTRFDFYDAAAALFKQSFTKQYYDWCRDNNLIMTGHFLYEDSLLYQTQWCGDVMSHYEFMHWPGIDKLGRHINEVVTVKQLSSATDQLGKERNLCEVFGTAGNQSSFFIRKWIADWQAVLGVNFSNHHLSLYSMRGERKRDHPANFFYQQPWWDDEREFADYQARLCAFAAEGKPLINILLMQPLASVWSVYSPLHKPGKYAGESVYDLPFEAISKLLLSEKLDFHYGNENLMAKYAAVKGKHITVGGCKYNCVIIPPSLNLKSSTVELLKEYAGAGGQLIMVGTPRYVDGVAAEINLPGAIVVESVEEAVKSAGKLIPDRLGITDRLTGKNAPKVYVSSRVLHKSTRHLIVNTDEARGVFASICIPQGRGAAMAAFDLYNGRLYRLNAVEGRFDIYLAPAGSLMVICGDEARGNLDAAPSILGSGAAFKSLLTDRPHILIDKFNCDPCEENILLLNNFTLFLEDRKVFEGPVCGAWHKHFYPAPEGTKFRAEYEFHSEENADGCFAAIEMAENLDSITMNGFPVSAMKARGEAGAMDAKKSWKDVSFTRVPLPQIKAGVNRLVIEGRKSNNITAPCSHSRVPNWKEHTPTEAEEVYICGRFSVKRLSGGLYGIAPESRPAGRNLTLEGFPFYCGKFTYRAAFNIQDMPEEEILLQINGAHMASANIEINGRRCGTLRWQPFVIDISDAVRQGENLLEITISTTLVNAFGPNRRAGVKLEERIGPNQFIDMSKFKEEYELFDFGLESIGIYLGGK